MKVDTIILIADFIAVLAMSIYIVWTPRELSKIRKLLEEKSAKKD